MLHRRHQAVGIARFHGHVDRQVAFGDPSGDPGRLDGFAAELPEETASDQPAQDGGHQQRRGAQGQHQASRAGMGLVGRPPGFLDPMGQQHHHVVQRDLIGFAHGAQFPVQVGPGLIQASGLDQVEEMLPAIDIARALVHDLANQGLAFGKMRQRLEPVQIPPGQFGFFLDDGRLARALGVIVAQQQIAQRDVDVQHVDGRFRHHGQPGRILMDDVVGLGLEPAQAVPADADDQDQQRAHRAESQAQAAADLEMMQLHDEIPSSFLN